MVDNVVASIWLNEEWITIKDWKWIEDEKKEGLGDRPDLAKDQREEWVNKRE